MIEIRNPYNYDVDAASVAAGFVNDEPSMAKQEFKEECDINTIARNFGLTGQMPVGVRPPTYGDFTGIGDFQTALNAVRSAAESFMQMSAEVRARFNNDPGLFVEFCSDEKNKPEAIKLGLALEGAAALARAAPAEVKASGAAQQLLEAVPVASEPARTS